MLKPILTALALSLTLAAPAWAGGEELILKTGTLSDFDRSGTLIYDQSIVLAQNPSLAEREVGEVVLSANTDDPDGVLLTFHKADGQRRLGAFPQSVGNPLFMYFVETVIRDMAGFTGGSPFYIRNRIKEALVNRAQISQTKTPLDGKKQMTQAVLVPFEDDPNHDRMQGFGGLTLTVVMSEDVTGWYQSLDATATEDGVIVYQRHLELRP